MNQYLDDGGCLAQDPSNANVVYAGGRYYNSSMGGYSMAVLKTTNGGVSWPVRSFPGTGGSYGTSCEAIAVAPSSPTTVYVGGQEDYNPKVFRSTDAGATWEDISGALATMLRTYETVYAIWVNPYDPTNFVVGTSRGVFRCSTEGRYHTRTWNMTSIEHQALDFAYEHPTGAIDAATFLGVYSSDDYGSTWQQVNEGLGHLECLCIDIDTQNRLLYVGTDGGSVWRMLLPDASGHEYFAVVDDFESYTDYDQGGEAIWQTWIDGLSLNIPENGSQVGYLIPTYIEPTIVHGGTQSMPYFYDNSSGYSEATMTLVYPRDWTMYGVESLTLWFYGEPTNAPEAMYVAIANSRQTPVMIYHDDPNAAQLSEWTQWSIDLKAFADQGVDLTNIDKLAIGFGDKYNPQAGGLGLVFFDDIWLYRPAESETDPRYN
ncbi:MAG: WD40/YVTN/BNR-like repeat-containing protein [Planctomycetota bacterium]